MILNNPTLVLTFLENDIEAGHSQNQTIPKDYIVRGSFKRQQQLLSELRSSSNQVSLAILQDSPSVEDIIATDGDVKAVLKDGDVTVFTGYISTNYKWTVTDHGEQALQITLEDCTTRLLNQPFAENEGQHLFSAQASVVIAAICAACGLTVSSSAPTITEQVTAVVEGSASCKSILDQLCYELGYVYYCDNLGQLNLYEINVESTDDLPVYDKEKLYIRHKQAVALTKNIRNYRAVRLTYQELGTAQNYLIYRNTTGQDSQHPYCNMQLNPGEHFDGAQIYTQQEWAAATEDSFREPTLLGAVNAASETEIVGGNEIISCSNVTSTIDKGANITASIVAAGGKYLRIDAENTGVGAQIIRRMDAYADIIFVKTQNIVRAGVDSASSQMRLNEEMTYLHTLSAAKKHANLLCQYHAYCNSVYAFNCKEDIPLGSLVTIHDNVFSGLKVNVMVTQKTDYDLGTIFEYKAIGVSAFNLDKDVFHRTTEEGKSDTKGDPGETPEVQYALGTSPLYPPSEYVLWDGVPVMWGDEPVLWNSDLYSDEVPERRSGTYVWMRTRIPGGEWQYIRLTGEDITDSEFQIYYSVSTSDTEYIPPSGEEAWSPIYQWYRGLFVWQRLVGTDAYGVRTASPPTYNKEITAGLEAAAVFRIQPESTTWQKNLAATGKTVTVKFDILASNFKTDADAIASIRSVVLTPYKNGTALPSSRISLPVPLASLSTAFTFPQSNDWDSVEIKANMLILKPSGAENINEYTSITLAAVDITQYGIYAGGFADNALLGKTAEELADEFFTTNYGGVLDGYSFVNETTKVIEIRTNGTWAALSLSADRAGQILALAEKDFWTLFDQATPEERVTLWALYGYKKEIISDSIASSKVIMYGDGIIESSGIDDADPVDAEGFLKARGYRFEGANGILRADSIIVSNGKFRKGTFEGITITGRSTFDGDILSDVLATQNIAVPGDNITAATPGANGAAQAVLGSEIKTNITARAAAQIAASTPSSVTAPAASGSLGNNKSFDHVMRIASASSGAYALDNLSGTDWETDEVLTFTNSYPVPIKVWGEYLEKSVVGLTYSTEYYWQLESTGFQGSPYSPSEIAQRNPYPKPDNPEVGDTWVEYLFDHQEELDPEEGRYWYYYTVNVYTYVEDTETYENTHYGDVRFLLNNTQIYPGYGGEITIPAGGVLKICLDAPTLDPDEEEGSSEAGNASVWWRASRTFRAGLLFIYNNAPSFYLDELTSNAIASSISLTVAGTAWLNLPMNTATAWTFDSTYGNINKLFTFAFTSAPSGTGTAASFSSQSVSITDANGNSVNVGTVSVIQYTTTSISITGSAGSASLTSGSGYYRAYSISISIIAKNEGVYTRNIEPQAASTYHVGTAVAGYDFYGVMHQSSSIKRKEQVRDFKASALEIMEKVNVVSFLYKNRTPETDYRHIGFIAEDTPEELATPKHDTMDIGSCVGLLIKAVQELNDKITRMEDK